MLQTYSEFPNKELTGKFSDEDRRWRLGILRSQLLSAETELARVQRAWAAELAGARAHGQHAIAEEFVKDLAARAAG
jgi:hypothetical protein